MTIQLIFHCHSSNGDMLAAAQGKKEFKFAGLKLSLIVVRNGNLYLELNSTYSPCLRFRRPFLFFI